LLESPDIFPAMKTMFTAAGDRVQLALTLALLAACSVNLMLVCAFL
jgi:hypothetical protein